MTYRRPWPALALNRTSALSGVQIALPILLAASVSAMGAAQAQIVVNDPTGSALNNSPFSKPHIQQPGRITTDSQASGKASAGKAEPLPPSMQPELDLQTTDEAAAPASGGKPLKARAVMVDITSNTLNYDKDRDVYVATGSVHMVISEQNSELYADRMTYDQNQDLVIAEGAVTIVKDGEKTHGSYAKIDLSRKSALINDYAATVEKVRIKSKQAFVNAKYVQYENGRIVISPSIMQGMRNAPNASARAKAQRDASDDNVLASEDLTSLATRQSREMERLEYSNDEDIDDDSLTGSASSSGGGLTSPFHLKVRDFDIHRSASGYDKINWRRPSLYYNDRKITSLPGTQFSFDEPSQTMEYLGPDIGMDPDYGGVYAGPGWDFQVGEHGSLRVSPIVSYGGSGRRSRGGSTFKRLGNGPGVGGILHYRDPKTRIDGGYNSHIGDPVLLAQRKLFDGKTVLQASANEDYIAGFLGYERPRYGLMVSDSRKVKEFGKFRLDEYASAGYFKDEFYPDWGDSKFFVNPDENAKPVYAGRGQVQLDFRNTEPLLRVGRTLSFGMRANVIGSAYTTGDFVGLVRGGPNMRINLLGNRLQTDLQYYYAATAGDTPFVFDSYYRGRQNLVMGNAFRVNDYLTMGLRTDMNLTRDNDRNAMFTGSQVYMLVGPKEVKMNLAYDVIRRRSYFGLNFYPGAEDRTVDFDRMRIYQPQNYNTLNPTP